MVVVTVSSRNVVDDDHDARDSGTVHTSAPTRNLRPPTIPGWRLTRSASGAGEQAGHGGRPRSTALEPELGVRVLQVPLDGPDRQHQLVGDRVVVVTLRGETKDV